MNKNKDAPEHEVIYLCPKGFIPQETWNQLCTTLFGLTFKELAQEMVANADGKYDEIYIKEGELLPMKTQTTIRLPVELKRGIEKEADKRNVSFNELVNLLLFKGLEIVNQGLL